MLNKATATCTTPGNSSWTGIYHRPHFDGLVQERRNSSALAMELRLSCINLSIYIQVEPLTKWLPFCFSRQYFKYIFLKEKFPILNKISLKIVPLVNKEALDKATNRPQTFTWNNVDQDVWCHRASQSHNKLWHCDAIWWHTSLVNNGSGYGLLPEGTKPLIEPMLTNDQWGLVAFTWGLVAFTWISQEMLKIFILIMNLKNSHLRLQRHLPGANDL